MLQDLVTPAQYWHDPFNQTAFLAGSHYLADINNEREQKNSSYSAGAVNNKLFISFSFDPSALTRLDMLVLAQWQQDTTIIPAASSQFGFYSLGQDNVVTPLRESELYTQDWLGLKQLDSEGKLHFPSMQGDHMDFDWEWFTENIVIPYLI